MSTSPSTPFVLLLCVLWVVNGQISFLDNISKGGGFPYFNQVTDVGLACKYYEGMANLVCRPTSTDWAALKPKCDSYRLYCKGLKPPDASPPPISGIVPPPPPNVCPQVNYCTGQRTRYATSCASPVDQDTANFCGLYKGYCADVPEDRKGLCASESTQQQDAQQQQARAVFSQQQLLAAQQAYARSFGQSYSGNPLPIYASQSMPGTYSNTGIIGRRRRANPIK